MQKTQYLRIFFFLVLSISLSSCSQYLKSNAKSKQAKNKKALYQPPKFHRVQKGETLYSIAWYYGYDYRQIALWNEIDFPYLIKPNQTIQLYPSLIRRASQSTEITHNKRASSLKNKTRRVQRQPASRVRHSAHQKNKHRSSAPKSRDNKHSSSSSQTGNRVAGSKITGKVKWVWPVRGKIAYRFSNKQGKKGLGISNKSGTRIVAAAAGRVVYSGSGLRGYGRLIIIKHNDTYLSAYANNKKILVKEQQKVKLGEHIADIGRNGSNKNILHFEIRKNGKPVNPTRYLPR